MLQLTVATSNIKGFKEQVWEKMRECLKEILQSLLLKCKVDMVATHMSLMVWECNFLGFDLEAAVTTTPPDL